MATNPNFGRFKEYPRWHEFVNPPKPEVRDENKITKDAVKAYFAKLKQK